MTWWQILLIVLGGAAVLLALSAVLYRPFFKRFYDFLLSLVAIVLFSPLLLVLTICGAISMRGNPFFTQQRPGKKEKIFKLIKFRTMNNLRDAEGNLLPDEKRLTKYGKLLRATSLDELPELFNILSGKMSIVGPRPLLVRYLPLYNDAQRRRHIVRPGLTGLAQVSGRNAISWEEKFAKDIEYIENITLFKDIKIIFMTVIKIFKREGISQVGEATMEFFTGNAAKTDDAHVLNVPADNAESASDEQCIDTNAADCVPDACVADKNKADIESSEQKQSATEQHCDETVCKNEFQEDDKTEEMVGEING